ncbi:MAG: glycosyltransferase family 2 protein [Bacteroidota bacterium]|jgi:glycosyltransferase involved in cell wall biosynthesis
MENKYRLSIVIPCYNEVDNLSELFKSLDALPVRQDGLEIILVNNGSTDGSDKVFLRELAKRDEYVFRVVNVEKNIGYGYGILSGLRAARAEILAITHADRQTDPSDVLTAYNIFLRESVQADNHLLVKGYRKNRKFTEAFFSWCMGVLSSLALGTRLTEINAQPKLFSKSFFQEFDRNAPHDFSLDLYLLYYAKKSGRIISFPVFFAPRVAGVAKGGSGSGLKTRMKLIKRIWSYIFELRSSIDDKK